MGGQAKFIQALENEFRNALVEHALAFYHGLFLGVEGGGVILEVHNNGVRLRTLIENLGLAFIDARAPAVHGENPQSYSVDYKLTYGGSFGRTQ